MTNQQNEYAPSDDSDQPAHPNAQADLSLRWAHTHFVGFVMSRLIYSIKSTEVSQTTHG